MIKSLELENFRKHSRLETTFTPGLNLVVGPNYTGKTTILQGILYALYGPTAVPGGSKAIKKRGASGATRAILSLSVGSDEVTLIRTDRDATLKLNGGIHATSATAVAEALEKILGLTNKQFMLTRYAAQGDAKGLVGVGSAELQRIIEEVSGAAVVSLVQGRAKHIATVAGAKVEAIPEVDVKGLQKDVKQSTEELTQFNANKQAEEALLPAAVGRYEAAAKATAMARTQREAWLVAVGKRDELLKRISVNKGHLSTAQEKLSNLPRVDREELEEQRAALHKKMEYMGTLSTRLAVADESNATILSLLNRRDAHAHSLENMGDLAPEIDLEELQSQMATISAEYTAQRARFEALKKGVCDACGQSLTKESPEHIAEEKMRCAEKLKELQSYHKDVKAELDTATAHNEGLASKLAARRVTLSRMNEVNEALEGKEAVDTDALKTETDEAVAESDLARKRLSVDEAALKAYEDAEREVAQYESTVATDEGTLEILVIPEEVALSELVENEKGLADKVRGIQQAISGAAQLVQSCGEKLERVEKDLEAAKAQEKLRNHEAKREKLATGLNKFLTKNRNALLQDLWGGVTGYASAFVSDCSGGAIEGITREEGGFAYIEDGVVMPAISGSGAQKALMGLGLQMALAEMLPCGVPSLLLDEPSADMDVQHSLAVSTLLSSSGKQVIMVSHRDLDGVAAENIIQL